MVAATGLWSMPGDYHMENYLHYAQHLPEMRFGSFIQAWSTHGGRGRVIAWGDSTIFSNFCLYQPGKAEVLLNLVEWLNHQGGTGPWWLWTALGLAAIGNGLWLVRHDGSAWLVLVAATACGWILGSTATAALSAREMPLPLPQEDRRLPLVMIDRTTSQVPLAKGAFNEDREGGRGFGLLEQSIPRLGYQTARAEGDDVFQGDAVVMICPSRGTTEAFRKRLIEYVDGGGRLLVIDAGLADVPSTANQILRPFGLSLDYTPALERRIGQTGDENREPAAPARLPWRKASFRPGSTLIARGISPAARVSPRSMRSWRSLIQATRCLRRPDDLRRGPVWQWPGDGRELRHYVQRQEPGQRLVAQSRRGGTSAHDLLFALLRRLVKDEPIVVPTRMPAHRAEDPCSAQSPGASRCASTARRGRITPAG